MITKPLRKGTPAQIDPFTLPVHPAAGVFPMLAEDELQELAEDIKANGLREPLVVQQVNGEVLLLDGRNRRAACERVGIQPEIRWLDPKEDAADYILSLNIARRHMTKGQRAMAVAMMYPDPARLRRKGSGSLETKEQISEARISQARSVLRHAPDLASKVINNEVGLDEAYKKAIKQRDQGTSDSAQRKKQRLPEEAKQAAGNPSDDAKAVGTPATESVKPQLSPDAEKDLLPDNFTKEQLDEAVATIVKGLAPSVVKKIEKSFWTVLQKMAAQVREKIDGEVAQERERLSQIEVDRKAELEAARKLRMGLDGYMSLEEFQIVRSCLHPDKHQDKSPEEQEKYTKAFGIFNRLRATVNTKEPISVARARGWEKVHPRYKPTKK